MSYEKLRANLKFTLKRDTAVFIKKLAEPSGGSKLSDKAMAVFNVLKTKDFGNAKEPLRSLMSILLAEELPSLKEASTLYNDVGFIAVVPIADTASSHEYHKDQTAAKLPGFEYGYTDQFVKQSGRIGGHMPTDLREFRPAKDDEIDTYVDKLTDETVAHIEKRVIILEVPVKVAA